MAVYHPSKLRQLCIKIGIRVDTSTIQYVALVIRASPDEGGVIRTKS